MSTIQWAGARGARPARVLEMRSHIGLHSCGMERYGESGIETCVCARWTCGAQRRPARRALSVISRWCVRARWAAGLAERNVSSCESDTVVVACARMRWVFFHASLRKCAPARCVAAHVEFPALSLPCAHGTQHEATAHPRSSSARKYDARQCLTASRDPLRTRDARRR